MKLPGFVAEASYDRTRDRYQQVSTFVVDSVRQAVEPSYRCNLYQVAKCQIFGEGDCWDKYCPIVQ